MTRNRFNQAKHQSTSTSISMNNLNPSKGHGLFLEDNDNSDVKDTYQNYKCSSSNVFKMFLIKVIVKITYYLLIMK